MNLPTIATLFMTNKCNFKCSFCLRQSKKIETSPDMSIEAIEKLLESFPTIKGLCLAGFGEPLMCENLEEILKFIKEKNVYCGLITNGSLLIDRFNILKKYSPNYISVSLNAPTQELHEKICHNKNQFIHILEGIKLYIKEGFNIYLSYVCDKFNLIHIPEFLRLAKTLKVREVHLINILPHHIKDEQTKNEFLNRVLTYWENESIDKIKTLPESNLITCYPTLIDPNNLKKWCRLAWSRISINGNGSISICNSIFSPKKENGTIYDKNVWENEYCTQFRKGFYGELPLACKYCFRNFMEK